jgi:hypothetical protein
MQTPRQLRPVSLPVGALTFQSRRTRKPPWPLPQDAAQRLLDRFDIDT